MGSHLGASSAEDSRMGPSSVMCSVQEIARVRSSVLWSVVGSTMVQHSGLCSVQVTPTGLSSVMHLALDSSTEHYLG